MGRRIGVHLQDRRVADLAAPPGETHGVDRPGPAAGAGGSRHDRLPPLATSGRGSFGSGAAGRTATPAVIGCRKSRDGRFDRSRRRCVQTTRARPAWGDPGGMLELAPRSIAPNSAFQRRRIAAQSDDHRWGQTRLWPATHDGRGRQGERGRQSSRLPQAPPESASHTVRVGRLTRTMVSARTEDGERRAGHRLMIAGEAAASPGPGVAILFQARVGGFRCSARHEPPRLRASGHIR